MGNVPLELLGVAKQLSLLPVAVLAACFVVPSSGQGCDFPHEPSAVLAPQRSPRKGAHQGLQLPSLLQSKVLELFPPGPWLLAMGVQHLSFHGTDLNVVPRAL